jgi:Kef-type K+ transport system membrane component KefB
MLFLLQIAIIAASAQLLGRLFRAFGQPAVAGEMTAGIALGPSLLGWMAPRLHAALFPESSFALLSLIGQLGLIFYMFLVGMTLDMRHLKDGRRAALAASIASIAVPFIAGFVLAAALYRRLSLPGVPLISFALFVAVSMSITAFPVLARILDEAGLRETRLGAVAIASAAFGDVVAWLILAAILAFSAPSAGHRGTGATLVLLAAYLMAMLLFRWIWARFGFRDLASALVIAIGSSIATDWIGVHALFGAFLAGVMIPKTPAFVEEMKRMVEPLTTVLFLPVFFAFTGLRTSIGLAFSVDAVLILAIAIAGKWMGAMLAARAAGMEPREANALGILMNARGLVELVILSIGLDLGLISSRVFSMLVMMAIVTTLMTTPLLRRFYSTAASPDCAPAVLPASTE